MLSWLVMIQNFSIYSMSLCNQKEKSTVAFPFEIYSQHGNVRRIPSLGFVFLTIASIFKWSHRLVPTLSNENDEVKHFHYNGENILQLNGFLLWINFKKFRFLSKQNNFLSPPVDVKDDENTFFVVIQIKLFLIPCRLSIPHSSRIHFIYKIYALCNYVVDSYCIL